MSKIDELAKMIEEAEKLLRNYGFVHWADRLTKDARLIRNLDFYRVEHLLSAFGGMGSLNDIYLTQVKTSEDVQRFELLVSSIYNLASALSREENGE